MFQANLLLLYSLGLIGEILLLLLLSSKLTKSFYLLIHSFTGSQKFSVFILALFFFPGTIIHELAHAFTARLLFVHVGNIEFMPEIQNGGLKLGSAQIGESDPLRRMFIGMAPFIWGNALVFALLYYAWSNFQTITHYTRWVLGLLLYVVFVIGNTMFSSRKDLEGALEGLLIIAFILAILYFTHLLPLLLQVTKLITTAQFTSFFGMVLVFLLIPIVLDLVIIGIIRLLIKKW